MKKITGLIILIVIIAISGGVYSAWDAIVNLSHSVGFVLQKTYQTFIALLPHWGLENKFVALFVFGVFLMIASAIGLFVSSKKQKKWWIAICSIVEAISSITALGCLLKGVS